MTHNAKREVHLNFSFIILFIVLVCLTALPGYQKSASLDLSFAVYSILLIFNFSRINRQHGTASFFLYLACLFGIGAATSSLIAHQVPLIEYLIICKPFILALALNFSLRTKIAASVWKLRFTIFRIVISFALLKYLASSVVLNYDRPFLFHENNFEIPLFILMYVWTHLRLKFNFDLIALIAVIVLSGSLSGYALLGYFLVIYSRLTAKNLTILVIASLTVLISSVTLTNVLERITNISGEERVVWLKDLQISESQKGEKILRFISTPRALPETFCATLSHFNRHAGARENECYSRSLHGNLPRLVVDFGLLPTVFFIMSFFNFIRKKLGNRKSYLIIGLGILNGLSVSGFGNIYFIAGVVLLLIPVPYSSSSSQKLIL